MIEMGMVTGFGLVLLIGAVGWILHRTTDAVGKVREDVNEERALRQKRGDQVFEELFRGLVAGDPIDQCIGKYQRDRTEIFSDTPVRGDGWNWSGDDVVGWSKREVKRRSAEHQRKGRFRAVAAGLVIVAVTAGTVAAYYNAVYSRPATFTPAPLAVGKVP